MKKEKTIYLSDVLWNIIYKWRILCICAIIGLAGMLGIKTYKNYKQIKKDDAKVEKYEKALSQYEEDLVQYKKDLITYEKDLDTYYKDKEEYVKAKEKYDEEYNVLIEKNEIYEAYKLKQTKPVKPTKPEKPEKPEKPKKVTTQNISMVYGYPKYAAVGVVGGIVVSSVCIACIYVVSNTIKKKEEFEETYGLRTFGDLFINTKKTNIIDSKIDNMRYKNYLTTKEYFDLVLTNLKITCQKNNYKELFLTSTIEFNGDENPLINKLIKGLNDNNIHTIYGKDITLNAESMNIMSKINNVVIIEQVNKTKYSSLEKELILCKNLGVNLMGVVTITEQ